MDNTMSNRIFTRIKYRCLLRFTTLTKLSLSYHIIILTAVKLKLENDEPFLFFMISILSTLACGSKSFF